MRPRIFIAPRKPFTTSPPYRSARAPDALPFLERFQRYSRQGHKNFALADGQAHVPLRGRRRQHFGRHAALANSGKATHAGAAARR